MSSNINIGNLQPLDNMPTDPEEVFHRILLHAITESCASVLFLAEDKGLTIKFDQNGRWHDGMCPPPDSRDYIINRLRKAAGIHDASWGQGAFTVTSQQGTATFTIHLSSPSRNNAMILLYRSGSSQSCGRSTKV